MQILCILGILIKLYYKLYIEYNSEDDKNMPTGGVL